MNIEDLGWIIVASADTINAAGASVLTDGHDRISIKGREKKVEVYEVIGLKS